MDITPSTRLYWELPKEARNLIDCLGWELALKVLDTFGGTRLLIPSGRRTSKGLDTLVELVGEEGFAKLVGMFGTVQVAIPLCQALKRERAYVLHRQGLSGEAIAKQLGVDWTTAYRWIWQAQEREEAKEARQPERQMNIF